jgi:hypothetical protein
MIFTETEIKYNSTATNNHTFIAPISLDILRKTFAYAIGLDTEQRV